MSPKPILYVSPLPPPPGGIATWTQKIVDFGLPQGQPFTIIDTKIRGKRNVFDKAKFSFAEIWRTLSLFFKLTFNLVWKRPRLVHFNCSLSPFGIVRDTLCVFISKTLQVPVIVQYHSNLPDFAYKGMYGLSGIALSLIMRSANFNIVINQASFNQAPYKHNLSLLPNFIEDSIFTKPMRQKLPAQKRVFYVGAITRVKGSRELIQVALTLPQVEFHLFGKLHDDMSDFSFPKNMTLFGVIAHDELLERMSQYHFLVFPTYSEGFPLTVLEAMALGLPVIASKVGAIPQMIDEGKGGLLCEAHDTKALSEKISTLLAQPALIQSMGEYNRDKSFKCYRYSKVINDYMHLYNQCK